MPCTSTQLVTLDAAQVRELDPYLERYALRSVRDRDAAREVVQETWAAAIAALPTFEGRSSLRTWLTTILRRKIVERYRRARPTETLDEARHGAVLRTSMGVERGLDQEVAISVVHAAMDRLPASEQAAVRLVDLEGVDREEAAVRLGVTRGDLRIRLHRGRAKLREALAEADVEAGAVAA